MRVIVLGSGVDRRHHRLLPGRGGPRGGGASTARTGRRWRPASPTPARSRPATPRPGRRPASRSRRCKWLFMRHRPLFIWPTPDPAMVALGPDDARNCTSARYEVNKSRMVPLAEYSRDLPARRCAREAGIAYDERTPGHAAAVPPQKQLDGTGKDIAILERLRRPLRTARRRRAASRVEPALGLVREKFAGGLRLPGDETGDCFKFTNALAAVCRQLGVEFRYGTRSTPSRPRAAGSPASSPTRARSRATPTWWRWAATRRCCCGRSASTCRSTR